MVFRSPKSLSTWKNRLSMFAAAGLLIFSWASPSSSINQAFQKGKLVSIRPGSRTAVPGILAWYFIFGGLLWQPREKPGIFAVRAGKKPDLVRHNSPNYGGVLFTTPP